MISANWFLNLFLPVTLLVSGSAAFAGTGNASPVSEVKNVLQATINLCDSVPQSKNVPNETTTTNDPSIIKEVPKSKKQVKPISIQSALHVIKPVQIIKPKILKPIIRIN